PAAGKRKANSASPVYKCGISDHKRTSHGLCPLNKKKKVVETFGSNVPGAVKDVLKIPALNAEHAEARGASGPHLLNDVDSPLGAETKTPCKSGSTEHQKISHKSGTLFRGAIKERFKVGDEEESFCTVKMGLNQFLACSLEDNEKQALTDVVNDAVQRLTDLSCEASRMLNGYSDGIMCQVFQAVQQKTLKAPYTFKSQKNELLKTYMNDVYSKIRDPKMAYCDASGLASIVNSIAKEYATNALNHIQMNIVRFTRQYVDFILSREVGYELGRKNYNQVKQFILAELERNSSDSNLKRFPFESLMFTKKKLVKRPQSEHDPLFTSLIKIWDSARNVLRCRNLTKSVVKKEWWLCIPYIFQMLKVVRAKYKEVPSRRFGYHITTDGVQVGISVLKPLNEAKVNEWGLDDEVVFHPLPTNSETQIVAIDPGRRNLYDAVAGDEDSRETRITRQKAYDVVPKELTDGDSNCIVAYGASKFNCLSKGHAPTPNKHRVVELRKRCRTRLVSEYRTSQVCANCNSQLEAVYIKYQTKDHKKKKKSKQKLRKKKLCWGLKKCINHSAEGIPYNFRCLTLWNRDLNAARNIRFMFLYRNANKNEMPDEFRKKKEGETKSNEQADISEACNSNQDSSQPQAADRVTAQAEAAAKTKKTVAITYDGVCRVPGKRLVNTEHQRELVLNN
ncbi:hypothetical protein MP638_006559, partial [Amoeboaphelidium occidentale]